MSEIKTVSGTVERIGEVEEVGSNGFTKRLLVIEVEDGQYSQKIPVEALKDKTSLFDGLNVGDMVTAYVNMRGSEWKDRVFLSLNCWKIETDAPAESDAPQIPGAGEGPDSPDEFSGDVPF